MSSHNTTMHNASRNARAKLLGRSKYASGMSDAAARLRAARMRAGYETAKDAALSLGFPVSTYLGHENGSRGYPAKKAFFYARKFKVSEQWLLYGTGKGPGSVGDTSAEIVDIFEHLSPLKRQAALDMMRGLAGSGGSA